MISRLMELLRGSSEDDSDTGSEYGDPTPISVEKDDLFRNRLHVNAQKRYTIHKVRLANEHEARAYCGLRRPIGDKGVEFYKTLDEDIHYDGICKRCAHYIESEGENTDE